MHFRLKFPERTRKEDPWVSDSELAEYLRQIGADITDLADRINPNPVFKEISNEKDKNREDNTEPVAGTTVPGDMPEVPDVPGEEPETVPGQ